MCQGVFNITRYPIISYSDIPLNGRLDLNPNGLANPFFKLPLATASGHEFRHVIPYALNDVNFPNSYGWTNVVNIRPAINSLDNAENHMYLDILAELESRKYRLRTPLAEALAGLLTYDASIS